LAYTVFTRFARSPRANFQARPTEQVLDHLFTIIVSRADVEVKVTVGPYTLTKPIIAPNGYNNW